MKTLSNIASFLIVSFVLLALAVNGARRLVSDNRGIAFLVGAGLLALILVR